MVQLVLSFGLECRSSVLEQKEDGASSKSALIALIIAHADINFRRAGRIVWRIVLALLLNCLLEAFNYSLAATRP